METRQSVLDAEIQIEVESLNYSSYAVGRADGFVVFTSGGVPGDRLLVRMKQIKKNYAVAELVDIVSASPHRCHPPCVHFIEGCGGCQWQHIAYDYQIQWKEEIVRQALKRIGKLEDVPEMEIHEMNSPLRYRNKLRLFPAEDPGMLGMRRAESHQVVPVKKCPISSDAINFLSPLFRGEIFSADSEISEIGIRASDTYQNVMLSCTYRRDNPMIEAHIHKLSEISAVSSVFYRIRRGKFIPGYGDSVIKEKIRGIEYRIGPQCFFQVNISGLNAIIDLVKEFAGRDNKLVVDAHCGVGTFALQMARISDMVWGVDISSSSISLARSNAVENGITNVHFRKGTISDLLSGELRDTPLDLVILDPPRKGCEKADLQAVIQAMPEKLIYISCNPTTFARDLHELSKSGYEILRLAMVDMFPMTYHLEVIALCARTEYFRKAQEDI